MSEKLRMLTEKIYQEGIEKAREESESMLELAKTEAKKIREEAQSEREDLISRTQKEMESYRQKVEADIKLAARKSVNKLKQDLQHVVQEKVISKPIQNLLSDPKETASLIQTCLESLQKNEQGNWIISIPENQKDIIRRVLEENKQSVLGEGVELKDKEGLSYGFEVQPSDSNFKLVFNDSAFIEFLSGFLEVNTSKLINESS